MDPRKSSTPPSNPSYRPSVMSNILPIVFLMAGLSSLRVMNTHASLPLLGTVLAFRNVETVFTTLLMASWFLSLAKSIRRYFAAMKPMQQPLSIKPKPKKSRSNAWTPFDHDRVFFAIVNWVLALGLLVALSPLTRDFAFAFASDPAHVDLGPLSHLWLLFSSIDQFQFIATLMNDYFSVIPNLIPAWTHPHMCYLFSLYVPAIMTGNVIAMVPFLTIANYNTTSYQLNRHFIFSVGFIPVIWFFIDHVTQLVSLHAIEKMWVYPETFLAGVAASIAISVGGCVPFLYKTTSTFRNKYLHIALMIAILGVVVHLFKSGRGHYERDIDQPIQLDADYTVLAKRGLNQIITDTSRGIRVMRAGHSLIGGVYQSSGDSVFAGFYYHDAHRFITGRPLAKYDPITPTSDPPKGLMIGYGVGIAAHMYAHLGVPLDVVEIDGLVLDLANQYFPLPDVPNNVTFIVDDGLKYIRKTPGAAYDFIIHDVFSGGSVASSLFSWQTIAHLKRILKPGGTLSINIVGRPYDHSFRHVSKTIRSVFANVRCFAEITDNTPPNGIINLVFFASTSPMDFRPSDPARDAFESAVRAYSHSIRAGNEIKLPGPPRAGFLDSQLDEEGLYYEWRGGDSDTMAADSDPVAFSSPSDDPIMDTVSGDFFYKLPVSAPSVIQSRPGGPSPDSVEKMPHILLDQDRIDRLAEASVDVAVNHYLIMHEVIPLYIWLFY